MWALSSDARQLPAGVAVANAVSADGQRLLIDALRANPQSSTISIVLSALPR